MESITFFQHIRHPFTIAAKKTLSPKERITAAALFCMGSLFGLIGGPLFFYAYTYRLKSKCIRKLKSSDVDKSLIFNILRNFKPVTQPEPDSIASVASVFTQPPVKSYAKPLVQTVVPSFVQPPAKPIAQPTPAKPVAQPAGQQPPPKPIAQPTPAKSVAQPTQAIPPAPPIDFGALKLLHHAQKAQGQNLENLYKTAQETLQSYAKGTPVSYPDLAKTKRNIDALEIALNELAVHWQLIKDDHPDPKAREMARNAIDETSGLSARLRRFIASSKDEIIRLTQTPINTKNLAHEVELMKKLPGELQDYRLESILATQYRLCTIKSDGNCGPRALAQGIGSGDEHSVRQEVTDHQRKNLDNPEMPWRDFYAENAENSIAEMQKSGRYFTDMELIAFSEVKMRPVGVFSLQSIKVENNQLRPANGNFWGEQYKSTPIWLYHRPDHDNSAQQNQLDLNHYDLLQPVTRAAAETHRELARSAPSA